MELTQWLGMTLIEHDIIIAGVVPRCLWLDGKRAAALSRQTVSSTTRRLGAFKINRKIFTRQFLKSQNVITRHRRGLIL